MHKNSFEVFSQLAESRCEEFSYIGVKCQPATIMNQAAMGNKKREKKKKKNKAEINFHTTSGKIK